MALRNAPLLIAPGTVGRGMLRIFWHQRGPTDILDGHEGAATAICPLDPNHFVSAGTDGVLRIWSLSTRTPIKSLRHHPGTIWTVSRMSNTHFISAGDDGVPCIWSEKSSQPEELPVSHGASIYTVCAINSNHILTAGFDTHPRVWKLGIRKPVHRLSGHATAIFGASRLDDNHFATAGEDGTVRIWRLGIETPVETFSHSSSVLSICSLTNSTLVTSTRDGFIHIWDRGSPSPRHSFQPPDHYFNSSAFPEPKALLCRITDDHFAHCGPLGITTWQLGCAEPIRLLTSESGARGICVLDDHHLASVHQDGKICIWHYDRRPDEVYFIVADGTASRLIEVSGVSFAASEDSALSQYNEIQLRASDHSRPSVEWAAAEEPSSYVPENASNALFEILESPNADLEARCEAALELASRPNEQLRVFDYVIDALHDAAADSPWVQACVGLAEDLQVIDQTRREALAAGLMHVAKQLQRPGPREVVWIALGRWATLVPTPELAQLQRFLVPGTDAETVQCVMQCLWNCVVLEPVLPDLPLLLQHCRNLLSKYLDTDWLILPFARSLTANVLLAFASLAPESELASMFERARALEHHFPWQLVRSTVRRMREHAKCYNLEAPRLGLLEAIVLR